jgi:hypothetical protein
VIFRGANPADVTVFKNAKGASVEAPFVFKRQTVSAMLQPSTTLADFGD